MAGAINSRVSTKLNDYRMSYLERRLCSHLDDDVRNTACDLVSEKSPLSKIYSQYGTITSDAERLLTLVPKAIYTLKDAIVAVQIKQLQQQMKTATSSEQSLSIMQQLQQLFATRNQLSPLIGDRVISSL